jgi:hypothetical protein
MQLSAITFERQFSRFKQTVQHNSEGRAFISFQEGLPANWEDYKADVRKEALRLLDIPRWKRADIGKGFFLRKLIEAIEIHEPTRDLRNNLVAWQNRYGPQSLPHRKLLEAKSKVSLRRPFDQWLWNFFKEDVSEETSFDEFRTLAGNRYDLIAYLFFLKDWRRFMPIAPTTFDKAFRLLGFNVTTARNCNWHNYLSYNAALLEVQKALREIDIPDARLIDAHSFCWMLVRLKLPSAQPAPAIPLPQALNDFQPAEIKPANLIDDEEFDVADEETFTRREAERRRLGKIAQQIALESEQRRLRAFGHLKPLEGARPVWNEPARGYDILSSEADGKPRYIEVKAARGTRRAMSFFITANEWRKSRSLPNYYFYLVLNPKSIKPIVLAVEGSRVSSACLAPVNYAASLVSN